MTLTVARKYAVRIERELRPYCRRIVCAGSVRRRCPECGDLDFVILPRPGARDHIRARCKRNADAISMDGAMIMSFRIRDIHIQVFWTEPRQRDLFDVRPGNWGSVLLCRTGPKGFNTAIAMLAQAQRMHWNPFWGLYAHNKNVASDTEHAIFQALGIEYVEPSLRDLASGLIMAAARSAWPQQETRNENTRLAAEPVA